MPGKSGNSVENHQKSPWFVAHQDPSDPNRIHRFSSPARRQAILGTRPCRRGRLEAHRTGTRASPWRPWPHPQSWPTSRNMVGKRSENIGPVFYWKIHPEVDQKKIWLLEILCLKLFVVWLQLIYGIASLLPWHAWVYHGLTYTINSWVLANTLGFDARSGFINKTLKLSKKVNVICGSMVTIVIYL